MHTTKSIVTFVSFKWNQEYIATTLCENRERPKLECDGKCYLKKQIKEQQESDESPLLPKKGQGFFDFFLAQEKEMFCFYFFEKGIKTIELGKTVFGANEDMNSRLLIHRILRPPALL